MVNKKINKRGETTLTSFLVGLVFIIGGFLGMYYYISGNATSAGVAIPDNYNTSFNTINDQLDSLDTEMESIKTGLADIKEEGITGQSLWNGLKGLGTVLLLPITTLNIAVEVTQAMFFPGTMTIIPSWVITLSILAITITIVMLILGALKGEQKT